MEKLNAPMHARRIYAHILPYGIICLQPRVPCSRMDQCTNSGSSSPSASRPKRQRCELTVPESPTPKDSRSSMERELDELERKREEDRMRREWFSGVKIFLAPPIYTKNCDAKFIATMNLRRLRNLASMYGAASTDLISVTAGVTHIVTYRKPGKTIRRQEVLDSLGGSEVQDIVRFGGFWHPAGKFTKIVYHEWLENCLAERRVLPTEDFEVAL